MVNYFLRLAFCALAAGMVGWPAWAQPTAPPQAAPVAVAPLTSVNVTLRESFDMAWQRAVSAREVDGQRRRAEVERSITSRLWAAAPTLELGLRADRMLGSSGGGRETEVGVGVPLWLPGQKAARTNTAAGEVALAQASEQVARLRLAGELREAAWQLVALRAEVDQANVQFTALRGLTDDVERRVRAGDLARADSLAARAEQLAAASSSTEARQRLQVAFARWTLLTGMSSSPEMSVATATLANDTAQHPEIQLASQATELARKRVELLRHSRRDAPELTLAVRQDTPGRGQTSKESFVIGMRLPFGSNDRNRPLETAVLVELDIAQTHEDRLRERLKSELSVASAAERSAQEQLDAETARARLLRERATLIEKSFNAGESALPDQLRALAAASQADSAVTRQTASLGLARARLQQSLGLMP